MIKKKIFLLLILLVLVSSVALAEKEIKTVAYFGGFVADASADVSYNKTFTFKSSDGFEQLYYMKAVIRLDTTTTNTRIYAKVGDEFCNPSYYDIATDEKDYIIMFDCTDVAYGEGQYTAGFQVNKNVKNVYVEWEFTYKNDPAVELEQIYENIKADISVGATYYEIGDNATIFAKVTEYGKAVDDAFCDVIIFAPNQIEVDGFQLNSVPNSRGLYSDAVIVPNETGVYMVDVECFRPINESHQIHYFRGEIGDDPPSDLFFSNESGVTQKRITIEDVTTGAFDCFPNRFSQSFSDFENGIFEEFRFLDNISDIRIYIEKNLGVIKDYKILLKFFKKTEKGAVYLGSITNTTGVDTVPTLVTFNIFNVGEPWDAMSLLEIEFCVRGVTEVGKDVSLLFNSQTENSSFVINTIDINATVDFQIGGSSELNVRDSISEDIILKMLEHAQILHDRIVNYHNTDYCIDNQTLQHNITYEYCIEGKCRILSDIENEICDYGCDLNRNECIPSPDIRWMYVGVVVAIIVLLIVLFKRYA